MSIINLTGQKFGLLTVLAEADAQICGKHRIRRYACLCDCGNTKTATQNNLRRGGTRSCGCLRKMLGGPRTKHGHSAHGRVTTTYNIWCAMIKRCTKPNRKDYKYYGGRGITVCERWRVYENFLADMGERPKGLSIDRINNDGNYEPNNCRWATREEQRANQRKCI